MAGINLRDYQLDAIKRMRNGCILKGGVGSGKSRTALAYYYVENGGVLDTDEYVPMGDPPQDLYIITTARKRDTLEWDLEMTPFLLSSARDVLYNHTVVVDSWNNIGKYEKVSNAFFIFDEQRVVGSGAWVKSFLKIAKENNWILLSATPGDTWQDYIPVFLANGFYTNKTQFTREHIVYNPRVNFPKIDRYVNTGKLINLRNQLLIDMDFKRETVPHHNIIETLYDETTYKQISKDRWNIYENKPVETPSELCYLCRKVVNSDKSRQDAVLEILKKHNKVIMFYNFDYELDILKNLNYEDGFSIAEWNGHKHQLIPASDKWVYLVQYTAGCEGWNCIETDTIVFYSQNYSYKVMAQAMGRTDRMNTPYKNLYYYHLKSNSNIDLAIEKALKNKKNFNEHKYVNW